MILNVVRLSSPNKRQRLSPAEQWGLMVWTVDSGAAALKGLFNQWLVIKHLY